MNPQRIGIGIGAIAFVVAALYFTSTGNAPATLTEQVEQAVTDQTSETAAATAALKKKPAPAPKKQLQNSKKKYMNATFKTNKGSITIEFMSADAPKTVENFTKLAAAGFYDGVKFHRVIKGFMIQGGDPLTKEEAKQALWGTGGPGYKFADEIHKNNHNNTGTIAMANAGPNTNGSQFFINVNDNNFLDGKHTVFGKVTAGMDVVKAIEAVATNQADRPLEPVIIESISLK